MPPPTPIQSQHTDLLPSYTQEASSDEHSVDAAQQQQATRPSSEKAASLQESSPSYEAYSTLLLQEHPALSEAGGDSSARISHSSQVQQQSKNDVSRCRQQVPSSPTIQADTDTDTDADMLLTRSMHTPSLTESNTAYQAGLRPCSVLPNRPAIWQVKRRHLALSTLAAAALTKEGLLEAKDLQLIPTTTDTTGAKRDPIDPVSGVLLGCYDTVGGILSGLAAGPVELGRQATATTRRDSTVKVDDASSSTGDGEAKSKGGGGGGGVAHASGQVAIGTAKGLGKVVTTSLKSPMLIMHGLTRGFHNLPRTYGEEVRQYETVTGLRSGLLVSAKSFGHGLGDGIRDLVAKPIDGAEKNGIIGFGTGLATGIANVVCKPAAAWIGACGLVGYSSMGVCKSLRKIGAAKKDDPAEVVRRLGKEEYRELCDADRLFIVRRWCQAQMRS
ncbi:UDP-glucosesterol transferase [Pyrenophora seminiperda CCB06]|uniref:UDP-glucosesterol transferase n=1 Tax=Pyrenophora seminiperda CCB06 TaxID=1302712 RepID=A0A3M7MBE0_9PLEO|nr:UDP-glucosesterol transferase [Pyrenophora seminiperda CCB06]